RSFSVGDTIKLSFRRDGASKTSSATLAGRISEVDSGGYRAGLAYLRGLQARGDSPAVRRELTSHRWQLGERSEALQELNESLRQFPQAVELRAWRLTLLLKTGAFERYVQDAIAESNQRLDNLELKLHRSEA